MANSIVTKYPVTLKRRGWSSLVTVLVLTTITGAWYFFGELFALIVLLITILYMPIRFLQLFHVKKYELKVDGEWLIERNFQSREIGRVNLSEPFEVEYLFKGYFEALYRVTQGETRLDFSEQTLGAPYVVKEILQLQWPPVGRWDWC